MGVEAEAKKVKKEKGKAKEKVQKKEKKHEPHPANKTRKRPPKHKQVGQGAGRVFPERKLKYFARANGLFDKFDKFLIVDCENVQSKQMQTVRLALRGKGDLLMGKNTTLRKVLELRAKTQGDARSETLYEKLVSGKLLVGNVGVICTDGDLKAILDLLDSNKIQAPARQGAIAPLDVIVPAGNTGLEPTKTSFFQALNIGTKITKGTVEIMKDEHIIKAGSKIGSSEATLLQMLNIKPFFYGLVVKYVYDHGSIYTRSVLEMSDETKRKMFETGIARVTALSLGLGFPTKASIPHILANAFKKVLAVSVASDFVFEKFGADKLREAILSGKALGPAPAAAPAATTAAAPAAKKEEAKPVEEEEEDGDMGFGLFD